MKRKHLIILMLSIFMLICSLTATACEFCWGGGYVPPDVEPTEPTEIPTYEYERIVTEDAVVFVTDYGIVSVPVTNIWIQQNESLEQLMEIYNQNFNN